MLHNRIKFSVTSAVLAPLSCGLRYNPNQEYIRSKEVKIISIPEAKSLIMFPMDIGTSDERKGMDIKAA